MWREDSELLSLHEAELAATSRFWSQLMVPSGDMKSVLLANDSYFSYLLARPYMEANADLISRVVLSNRTTGSLKRLRSIYEKTHLRYFVYRGLIEVGPKLHPGLRGQTIGRLAAELGLPVTVESNINKAIKDAPESFEADVALAFNLDQIVTDDLIGCFEHGVVNVHASKLPQDKGVSPVLWAFARGEDTLWVTIYKMDAGIDSGPILDQFTVPVERGDTAFSAYVRVCQSAGERLTEVISMLGEGTLEARPQVADENAVYWSWPDASHRRMMRTSRRRFISPGDLVRWSSLDRKRA